MRLVSRTRPCPPTRLWRSSTVPYAPVRTGHASKGSSEEEESAGSLDQGARQPDLLLHTVSVFYDHGRATPGSGPKTSATPGAVRLGVRRQAPQMPVEGRSSLPVASRREEILRGHAMTGLGPAGEVVPILGRRPAHRPAWEDGAGPCTSLGVCRHFLPRSAHQPRISCEAGMSGSGSATATFSTVRASGVPAPAGLRRRRFGGMASFALPLPSSRAFPPPSAAGTV